MLQILGALVLRYILGLGAYRAAAKSKKNVFETITYAEDIQYLSWIIHAIVKIRKL